MHRIFDSENFRWETIKRQKIVGNLLDNLVTFENCTWMERFLAFLKLYWKILDKVCFSGQIFHRKQSLGTPK